MERGDMAQRALTISSRRPLVAVARLLGYLVILVFSLVVAYPLIAVLFDSFKTQYQFFDNPWTPPLSLDWSSYTYAWTVARIPQFMVNSTIVSAATILLTLA